MTMYAEVNVVKSRLAEKLAAYPNFNEVVGAAVMKDPALLLSLEDRCVGSLLGVMVGDALGAAVEGWGVRKMALLGPGGVHSFVPSTHMGIYDLPERYGHYTDDTNSTLALAHSLATNKGLVPAHAALSYAQFWKTPPQRGYPDSATQVLQKILDGASYTTTGTLCFPDGSFANGGAMRSSPIGLAFRHASLPQLYAATREAIRSSHVHPEGVDGAFVQAVAVQYCLRVQPADFSPSAFLQHLLAAAQTEPMRKNLSALLDTLCQPLPATAAAFTNPPAAPTQADKRLPHQGVMACNRRVVGKAAAAAGTEPAPPPSSTTAATTTSPPPPTDATPAHSSKGAAMEVDSLPCGSAAPKRPITVNSLELTRDVAMFQALQIGTFQIKAVEAVTCAVWGVCCWHDDPEAALIKTVAFGGDTDTVASMAGAMLGALHGTSWIPCRWFNDLENGTHGRDFCVALGRQLALLDLTEVTTA